MSLLGLIPKFRVDRLLNSRERQLRLDQKQRMGTKPLGQVSTIKLNSTYIELIDKYFIGKGLVTFFSVVVIGLVTAAIIYFAHLAPELISGIYKERLGEFAAAMAFLGVVSVVASIIPSVGIRNEAFRYTHYPIRLNRVNRMVYVHRIDGTILRIPWDEVFFTLVQEPMFPSGMGANWAIHGHVLDADGETVRETFAFSEVEIPEIVTGHWEFLRRYMEEGPEAVVDCIKYYVPVSTSSRRESWREGLRHLRMRYGQYAPVALIYFPFDLASSLARWVAMRTGKLPVWPDDVEAECAVADDDPWVRDARNNPAKYR
ncbi:DUF6708 domain-containing protein [Stenotrophomonas hibiscicola]|uniref:DUF6708 domain-containing protein n=2 Tax=Stenotrophomonas hibiscicola TaxID=86189 RepID=UPI002E79EDED|nr:DUF6708 domain-containing protein [[Pseudomonas] hibiscicola]